MFTVISGAITFMGAIFLFGMVGAAIITGAGLLYSIGVALQSLLIAIIKKLLWLSGFILYCVWRVIRRPSELPHMLRNVFIAPFAIIFAICLGITDPVRTLFSKSDQSPKHHSAELLPPKQKIR